MRTSTLIGIPAVSLAAVLGGSLIVGSAVDASATPTGSGHGDRGTSLYLTSETLQFAVIDVGSAGPALGLGDQIVSSDQVMRHGKPAGRGGTVMTVVAVSPSELTTQIVTTLDLHDGQLVLHGIGDGPTGPPTGPPTEPLAFTMAVTGGTGSYQNARGFAEIIDRPGGTETITIRLGE